MSSEIYRKPKLLYAPLPTLLKLEHFGFIKMVDGRITESNLPPLFRLFGRAWKLVDGRLVRVAEYSVEYPQVVFIAPTASRKGFGGELIGYDYHGVQCYYENFHFFDTLREARVYLRSVNKNIAYFKLTGGKFNSHFGSTKSSNTHV